MKKREAIRNCRDLWTWCAKNPTKTKWEWPKWKIGQGYRYKGTRILNACFACQYDRKAYKVGDPECYHCFLLHTWINKKDPKAKPRRTDYACEKYANSPYQAFRFTDGTISKQNARIKRNAALKIANACRRLLNQKELTVEDVA